mmetsp:Transcript_64974/g.107898  ORF Transcript_64974/g.107898 Transcript_64974/m.107898 type:complete len:226 (-) Transcript_64974:92-769(-)
MRHDTCKGGSTSSRTEAGIPKIPSPAPNHRIKLDLLGHREIGTAKFHAVPKSRRNNTTVVLTQGCSCNKRGGGGTCWWTNKWPIVQTRRQAAVGSAKRAARVARVALATGPQCPPCATAVCSTVRLTAVPSALLMPCHRTSILPSPQHTPHAHKPFPRPAHTPPHAHANKATSMALQQHHPSHASANPRPWLPGSGSGGNSEETWGRRVWTSLCYRTARTTEHML